MVQIREMQIDDIEGVMKIENENFVRPWTENGMFSFLLRADALFLVAEEEGKIWGYCGAVTVLDEGDVVKVAVAKERQNQGIGKLLMEELIRKTTEAGIGKLFLEVRAGNPSAIHLYEKAGFVQSGIRKNYYEELGEDALAMMRVLPSIPSGNQ